MKKKLNIIFILIVIFLLTFIVILNKFVVTSEFLEIAKWNLSYIHQKRNLIYTFLNLSKKFKFNNVIIGASSMSASLNTEKVDYNALIINPQGISPIEEYDLLKYYLKIHPETKNLIHI